MNLLRHQKEMLRDIAGPPRSSPGPVDSVDLVLGEVGEAREPGLVWAEAWLWRKSL